LPARPEYFLQDAAINQQGASSLADLPQAEALEAKAVYDLLRAGAMALDVRTPDQFAAGHVPRAINIALSGQFASWAGTVLGLDSNPILIADSYEQVKEARMRLARVGIERVRGYLHNGVAGWTQAGFQLMEVPQMSVRRPRRGTAPAARGGARRPPRTGSGRRVTSREPRGMRLMASRPRFLIFPARPRWWCTARAATAA